MNNPKWGVKRQCLECGTRFYDLKRAKVVCPKCETPFKMEAPPKAKRAIATPANSDLPAPAGKAPEKADQPVEKAEQPTESAEDKAIKELTVDIPKDAGNDESDGDDKEEDAFEDVSEFGEDEDDMAEVIDGSRKAEETRQR